MLCILSLDSQLRVACLGHDVFGENSSTWMQGVKSTVIFAPMSFLLGTLTTIVLVGPCTVRSIRQVPTHSVNNFHHLLLQTKACLFTCHVQN